MLWHFSKRCMFLLVLVIVGCNLQSPNLKGKGRLIQAEEEVKIGVNLTKVFGVETSAGGFVLGDIGFDISNGELSGRLRCEKPIEGFGKVEEVVEVAQDRGMLVGVSVEELKNLSCVGKFLKGLKVALFRNEGQELSEELVKQQMESAKTLEEVANGVWNDFRQSIKVIVDKEGLKLSFQIPLPHETTRYYLVTEIPLGSDAGSIYIAAKVLLEVMTLRALSQEVVVQEDRVQSIILQSEGASAEDLSYEIVTMPSHGSIALHLPEVIYTPAPNYFGSDQFTFRAKAFGRESLGTVSIVVLSENDLPVARDASFVSRSVPVEGLLQLVDEDDSSHVFSFVATPGKGTVSWLDSSLGRFRYVPASGASGVDTFTYKASDGKNFSNTARVTITLLPSESKLLASDGSSGDYFGHSVSVSGDRIVVGAYGDDDWGSNSGSAYVYKFNGTNWVQERKITASDGSSSDYFGQSVSVSGDRIVVGAYGDDGRGSNSGSAYVYKFNGTNWVQERKITASDGSSSDYFGQSVSVSGDRIVVGAYGDDDKGSSSGSAYVYKFNGTNWVQERKITASDGSSWDYFGNSVSISGDRVVVGAAYDDDEGGDSGSAYVYKFTGTNWVQEGKITASDGSSWDNFGDSVSISGDRVVVGSPFDDTEGSANKGSAYVY